MGKTVVRNSTLKILGTLASGAGDNLLTINSGSKDVTSVPSTGAALSNVLTSGHIFVGNASNVATDVALTGMIAISNAGVSSIVSNSIQNVHINSSANIAVSKLAAGSNGQVLTTVGTTPTWVNTSNGTVTTISSGNLNPIFTTSISNPTTTPAISFVLTNAAQNTVLAGPTSGAGAPTYRSIVDADITALNWSKIIATPTTVAGYGIIDAQPILVSGTNIKTINGVSILGSGDISVGASLVNGSGLTFTTDHYDLGGTLTSSAIITGGGINGLTFGTSGSKISGIGFVISSGGLSIDTTGDLLTTVGGSTGIVLSTTNYGSLTIGPSGAWLLNNNAEGFHTNSHQIKMGAFANFNLEVDASTGNTTLNQGSYFALRGNDGSSSTEFRQYESTDPSARYIGFSSPLLTPSPLTGGQHKYIWPSAYPVNGNVLTMSNATTGQLSWTVPSGGVSDGNKGDITVTGTGTVWTINNAAVTGAKIASSIALAGNPTTTTQAEFTRNTTISTTAYADRAAGQFATKGQVINETFTSSFANYTSVGTATWSITGSALQGVGGTAFDLASYVSHSTWGNTAIRNSTSSVEVTVGTITSTSQGVQIALFGKGAGGQNSVNFVLRLNTARQGFLECYINNTSALVGGDDFSHSSVVALTVASGDRVKLVLDIVENEYIFRAVNLTQTSVQPVSLVVTTSPVSRTQWANYSTIQFGVGVVGGTHKFNNHIVNVNDPIAPDILIAGDSIATGAGVINVEQSYPKQLEGLSNLKVMRWSGGGNVARDLRGADILRYNPRIVVIDIGVNDIITGRSSPQIITDINQIITDLGAGYTLGVNLFVCEVLPYATFSSQVQTYNTAYQTNYAAGLIRWYQSFNNGSGGMQTTLVNADLLHPNWSGHKLKADYLYQDLRERAVITATSRPKSNQSQLYTYDGKLGLGWPNPFTPTYALQIVSNRQQFIIGNDATNPTYGGGGVSTSATHMSLRSGMVFDGSNNISTGTAGQSELILQDGALSWRSNTGITAGSSVGTMTTYFRGLSTGLFGIGAGLTTPLSQLHISADASASQGILLELHAATQTENSIILRKSRGSLSSAAAIIDTDYGSMVKFDHHSGSSYLRTVSMGTRVNGTVTTSSIPTDFFIATSATGTTDPYTNGTVKFLISSAGNVGIGMTSASARLHLPAGTATASTAPLKFTSGTVLTSAEAGVMEYDGTNFYMSPSTTRKRIPLSNNATPSNGQILIGNGTDFTTASITAGTGISITPGAGTLTIAVTGGSGDVVGPASAVDNRIARFDLTTGKLIQNSLLGIDDSGHLIDANGNELIKFTATSSAVNEITVTNNTTGNVPSITATGGDTDVSLDIKAKGAGFLGLRGDGIDFGSVSALTARIYNTGTVRLAFVNSDAVIEANAGTSVGPSGSVTLRTLDAPGGGGAVGSGNIILKTGAGFSGGIEGSLSIFSSSPSFGGGGKVIFEANASTVPSSNPTGGAIRYVEGGVEKYRDTAGNIITI